MNDLDQEFLKGLEQSPDYQSPGALAVASADALEAQTKRATLDTEAEKAWRDSGIDMPYNYKAAFAEGQTNFKDQPLPNQHIPKDAVAVAGFDLATGAKRRSIVADRQGIAEAGVKELRSSVQLVKPGKPAEAPPADSAGLAKIALTFLREGKTVDDFTKGVGGGPWQQAHWTTAWNAAVNAENTRVLAYSLAGDRSLIPAEPPDQEVAVLHADPAYAKAARRVYQSYKGEPFAGTETEVSQWMTEHLRDFTINPTMGAVIWARALGGSRELKDSYLYALTQYDRTNVDWSVSNVSANVGRAVFDVTNLLAPGIGKAIFTTAGKVAFKAMLTRGAVGAGVGTAVGGAQVLETADITGTKASGGDVAAGMAVTGAAFAGLSAAAPLLLASGGKLLSRAHENLANSPLIPVGSRRSQFGQVDLRSHDPKSGIGELASWEFERSPELKMDKASASGRVKNLGGLSADARATAEAAVEDLFSDGAKTKTGADIAEAINEVASPPRVQWIAPGPPPKKFGKVAVEDFLQSNPEYAQVSEAERGMREIRRDIMDEKDAGGDHAQLAARRLEINKSLRDAGARLRQISADLVSPEEAGKGLMFGPGQHSDFPMGARLEKALEGDKVYQGLKAEQSAELAKPMHWDRQAKLGSLNYSISRHLQSNFSPEEVAAGRAWREGQPRAVPPAPMGPSLDEHFAGHPEYEKLKGELGDLNSSIEQGLEMRPDASGPEAADLKLTIEEDLARRDLVQTSLDQFLRTNTSTVEYNHKRMYATEQVQGRIRVASNIAHLQSVGTPDRYGLKPESEFQWLEIGDPASRRAGYEGHVGNELGTQAWAPVTVHNMDDGGKVLVPHEMQSDWAKNLREARRDWDTNRGTDDRSYDQLRWDNYIDWSTDEGSMKRAALPAEWTQASLAEREAMVRSGFFEAKKYLKVDGRDVTYNQAPMRMERTYMLNLMKAATYRAAQQGLDAVAFPDQAHIAGRWKSTGEPVRAGGLIITSDGLALPAKPGGSVRLQTQFFRGKTEEQGRNQLASFLEEQGEKEAAQALRRWTAGDGPVNIKLSKQTELVPMGFQEYRESMKEYQKWTKKEFGVTPQDIKGDFGMQPIKVEGVEGKTVEERSFKGMKMDEKLREQILKKGIHMSKMTSHYAVA